MRITGYFGKYGAPWVDAKLGRQDGKEPIDVSFLIDTGAYGSLVSLREIHRLGVSVHELRRSVGSAVGFGGRSQFYFLQNVEITFATDHGPRTEFLPRVLTPIGPATGEHRKRPHIQSLLGRDILDRFALHLDKRSGLVLLTDELLLGGGERVPAAVPHAAVNGAQGGADSSVDPDRDGWQRDAGAPQPFPGSGSPRR